MQSSATFEQYCAERLESCGWNARRVGGSGDQGADVIADKGEYRLVVQCKYYTGAVNNKAVQEVIAAKAWTNATHAAVVAPNGFTPGAFAIARKAGVVLLHQSQIADIDRILGLPSIARVVRMCPSCRTLLRVPFGRIGRVVCRCGRKFLANTLWR